MISLSIQIHFLFLDLLILIQRHHTHSIEKDKKEGRDIKAIKSYKPILVNLYFFQVYLPIYIPPELSSPLHIQIEDQTPKTFIMSSAAITSTLRCPLRSVRRFSGGPPRPESRSARFLATSFIFTAVVLPFVPPALESNRERKNGGPHGYHDR